MINGCRWQWWWWCEYNYIHLLKVGIVYDGALHGITAGRAGTWVAGLTM